MRRAPRRPWRPSALLLALAMCDLAPTRYARPLPTDCARREGRLAAYPCSDESCRVFSAHYLGWILRKGEVLASRQVLQGTGVVDVDCPVCLGVLKAGEGVVTFLILECGHRCAAPPFTCTAFPTTASMPAVPVLLSPPPPHHVRFPAACASQDPRRMLAQGQGDGDCIGCRAHVPALSRRVALHAHVCAQGRIGVMLRRSCTCRRPFWGAGRAGSRSSSHLHIVWSYIRYILYELSMYDWRPVSSPDPYVNAVSSCPGVVRVCSALALAGTRKRVTAWGLCSMPRGSQAVPVNMAKSKRRYRRPV